MKNIDSFFSSLKVMLQKSRNKDNIVLVNGIDVGVVSTASNSKILIVTNPYYGTVRHVYSIKPKDHVSYLSSGKFQCKNFSIEIFQKVPLP